MERDTLEDAGKRPEAILELMKNLRSLRSKSLHQEQRFYSCVRKKDLEQRSIRHYLRAFAIIYLGRSVVYDVAHGLRVPTLGTVVDWELEMRSQFKTSRMSHTKL
jgi:hypothetical protein